MIKSSFQVSKNYTRLLSIPSFPRQVQLQPPYRTPGFAFGAQFPEPVAKAKNRGRILRFFQRFPVHSYIEKSLLATNMVADNSAANIIGKVGASAFWFFAGTGFLGTIGVDITPLLAGVSVTGLSLGFAAKDISSSFMSGFLLLLQRPFQVGQYVRLSSDLQGYVDSIDIRYTYLHKPVDSHGNHEKKLSKIASFQIVKVPNNTIYSSTITILPDLSSDKYLEFVQSQSEITKKVPNPDLVPHEESTAQTLDVNPPKQTPKSDVDTGNDESPKPPVK